MIVDQHSRPRRFGVGPYSFVAALFRRHGWTLAHVSARKMKPPSRTETCASVEAALAAAAISRALPLAGNALGPRLRPRRNPGRSFRCSPAKFANNSCSLSDDLLSIRQEIVSASHQAAARSSLLR